MPTGYTAEAPLQWETLALADLIPSELEDVVDLMNELIAAVGAIMDVLNAALDVAKMFLLGLEDGLAIFYNAIVTLVESLVQQLTQTGIYNLVHYTPSFSMYMTPDEWISAVANSLDDRMDAARPILVDEFAYVGAVALMTTSDNLKDLLISWRQFCSMLGAFVGDLFLQVQGWPEPGDEFEVIPGVGQVPNWRSIKLGDVIPGLSQAGDFLMAMLNSLALPTSSLGLFEEFADFLDAKIAMMESYGAKILGVLAMISAILSVEGIYMLRITGQGDASWLKERLHTAEGGPHEYGIYDFQGNEIPEELRKSATFTLGTVFLVTGGTTSAVEFLPAFFGGNVLRVAGDIPALPDVP
jgi:hypothetical protein